MTKSKKTINISEFKDLGDFLNKEYNNTEVHFVAKISGVGIGGGKYKHTCIVPNGIDSEGGERTTMYFTLNSTITTGKFPRAITGFYDFDSKEPQSTLKKIIDDAGKKGEKVYFIAKKIAGSGDLFGVSKIYRTEQTTKKHTPIVTEYPPKI